MRGGLVAKLYVSLLRLDIGMRLAGRKRRGFHTAQYVHEAQVRKFACIDYGLSDISFQNTLYELKISQIQTRPCESI